MSTHARTRPKQAVVGENEEDRISNLPDALLTHILSFLSTKEAICSSILSRKWKSIWTYLPTIGWSDDEFFDPDDEEYIYEEMLNEFVDSALVRRKMPYLQSVSLNGPGFKPRVVKSWISAAIKRKILSLKLSVSTYEHPIPVLPQSMFFGCSLVIFKLSMRSVLNFPHASVACFPQLKVLGLSLVRFKGNDSATNLISSCPVLEDLGIVTDEQKSFQTLNVTSSSLKTLSLDYSVQRRKFDNLPKILIDTPALEFIHISDDVPNLYEVKELSSLVRAEIDVSDYTRPRPFQDNYSALRIFELLDKISKVKSLSISSWTMETLSSVDRWNLPIFHNLTSLEFHDMLSSGYLDWKLVIAFLKSSPVLELLIFKGFLFSHEDLGIGNWVDDVPSCLISNLKTIKISKSSGRFEVEKVRYFLKNAKVLEKMIIKGSMKAAGELLTLPRGSPTCQIEIRPNKFF